MSSFFMASMLLLLLRIIVDKLKNFEFLSPSLSHNSLDFCRQITTLLRSHSESSIWRAFSTNSFSREGCLSSTSLIFLSRILILFWQWLKTSLFNLRRASLVTPCFLYSLVKSDPATFNYTVAPFILEPNCLKFKRSISEAVGSNLCLGGLVYGQT